MKVLGLLVLVVLFMVQSTFGQEQPMTWVVRYYDNPDFRGTPVLTQTRQEVSISWDINAPAPNIPADHFSVRWMTTQYLTSGGYRVSVTADDAVMVRVNGVMVIDTFLQPLPGQNFTADLALTEGLHTIEVGYREDTGRADILFDWTMLPQIPLEAVVIPSSPGVVGDHWVWTAEYFPNMTLQDAPVVVRDETGLNYQWGEAAPVEGLPADQWSARWSTIAALPVGTYRLTVNADDGVRVRVDGATVIDPWHLATQEVYTAVIPLTSTTHTFVVEYFDDGLLAFLNFSLDYLGTDYVPPVPMTNAFLTTGDFTVNVRAEPTTDSPVVMRINPGEQHPVIGRNLDRTWWQVVVEGQVGWVFGRFVFPRSVADVPVTSFTAPITVAGTGYTLTALDNTSVRAETRNGSAFLGTLREGQQAEIIAVSPDYQWWRVRFENVVGWVQSQDVRLNGTVLRNFVPVLDG